MPGTTPGQALPVPVVGDDPDVADDMNKLALAIEKRLVGVYASVADRSAKVTAPQEGQFSFLKDTDTFAYYSGTAWVVFPPVGPTFTSSTSTPSNATGANGDVHFKY